MTRRTALLTGLLGVVFIGGPFGQTSAPGPARLLRDINDGPTYDAGSFAQDFVRLGRTILFTATTPGTGWALWRTDGTRAGTTLVKDIDPASLYEAPSGLIAWNGAVYFGADDGIHGPELWKTDGTPAGTVLVKDIHQGPNGSLLLTRIIVFRGQLFFKANDGVHGLELWKSDGTQAGTVLVKDTDPATTSWGGLNGNDIVLTEAGGSLFFPSVDLVHGSELWKTDGTEAGTVLVKDINPGFSSAVPSNFFDPVELNGILFFQAYDDEHGQGLWKSDGTEAGTVLLLDVAPVHGLIYELAVASGNVFFVADDDIHGPELWKTDGTQAGTVLVREISPEAYPYPRGLTELGGTLYFFAGEEWNRGGLYRSDGTEAGTVLVKELSGPAYLTPSDGSLYFANSDGIHGIELWRSDGTEGGTALLKDIYPGALSSFSVQSFTSPFQDIDGTLYFSADDGVHGYEIWKSDGTAAGTSLVADVNGFAQTGHASPLALAEVGGTVYFSARSRHDSIDLWRTDGTTAGTVLVKDFGLGFDPGVAGPAVTIEGVLFFAASDREHGIELWRSDGTEAGTLLVKDINTQFIEDIPLSSRPLSFFELDGTLYFAANDGIHGYELWKSDGSEAGTVMVKDLDPEATHSVLGWFSRTAGGLVFAADDGVHGRELWRTDGTEAGTVLVKDIYPGHSSAFSSLSVTRPELGGSAFFTAYDGTHGTEMWKSDGTEEGTVLVKDLCPGACSSALSLGQARVVNGNLYFTTVDVRSMGDLHTELWRTDGTEQGTVLVKTFYPGIYSPLSRLFVVGGTLFFRADDGIHGVELWKSDGTPEGTVLVKDIHAGDAGSSNPGSFTMAVADDGVFYFPADDGVHGIEMWSSDGTEEGTVLVKDIHLGDGASQPTQITVIEGSLLFKADDGIHGIEMWRSDGTEEGTVLVQDIAPGPAGSGTFFSSTEPTLIGSRLIFSMNDELHGSELWYGRAAILIGQPRRAIRDLGDELEGLDLPGGLGRVLRRALDLASSALENPGGRRDAIDAMGRFIRKIQVLSPRHVSDEDRASLIEFAEDIIDLLNSSASADDGDGPDRRIRDRRGRPGASQPAGVSHDEAGLE